MLLGTRRALLSTRQPTYADKVLSIQRANLLAYWKYAEASGTTIVDSSGNARNGTYAGVDLGQPGIGDGGTAPLWDGVNDYANVYAGIGSVFTPAEGSVTLWGKVASAGVWTDATARYCAQFNASGSNLIRLTKNTTSNQLEGRYIAGGTVKSVASTVLAGSTAWFHAALTWSVAADQFRFYINGAQVGTTQTGLGTWAGALASAATTVGAQSITPAGVWSGYLAHAALWSTPLSAAEIARLAVISG